MTKSREANSANINSVITDVLNYKIFPLLGDDSLVAMTQTSHQLHTFFQTEIDKRRSNQLGKYIQEGDMCYAEAIVSWNPSLLLRPIEKILNPMTQQIIEGMTPLQAAFCETNYEMCLLFREYFKVIFKTAEEAERAAVQQLRDKFAEKNYEAENKKLREILTNVTEAIANEKFDNRQNGNSGKFLLNEATRTAIITFREAFAASQPKIIKSGRRFRLEQLREVYSAYVKLHHECPDAKKQALMEDGVLSFVLRYLTPVDALRFSHEMKPSASQFYRTLRSASAKFVLEGSYVNIASDTYGRNPLRCISLLRDLCRQQNLNSQYLLDDNSRETSRALLNEILSFDESEIERSEGIEDSIAEIARSNESKDKYKERSLFNSVDNALGSLVLKLAETSLTFIEYCNKHPDLWQEYLIQQKYHGETLISINQQESCTTLQQYIGQYLLKQRGKCLNLDLLDKACEMNILPALLARCHYSLQQLQAAQLSPDEIKKTVESILTDILHINDQYWAPGHIYSYDIFMKLAEIHSNDHEMTRHFQLCALECVLMAAKLFYHPISQMLLHDHDIKNRVKKLTSFEKTEDEVLQKLHIDKENKNYTDAREKVERQTAKLKITDGLKVLLEEDEPEAISKIEHQTWTIDYVRTHSEVDSHVDEEWDTLSQLLKNRSAEFILKLMVHSKACRKHFKDHADQWNTILKENGFHAQAKSFMKNKEPCANFKKYVGNYLFFKRGKSGDKPAQLPEAISTLKCA